MKRSKKKTKSRIKAESSRLHPKPPESLIGDDGEVEEAGNEGKRDFDWLTSAFPCMPLEHIDSAYKEAGGDAYMAAGILGAELVDPGENARSSGNKRRARKQKRVAASTGMISGVIGRDYSRSASACYGLRRDDLLETVEGATTSRKEAEDFLFSMLGGDSELSVDVIRDVLSHCRYDVEKALDILLDISKLSRNQLKEIIGVDHVEVVSCKNRKGGVRNSEIHHEMPNKESSSNSQSSLQGLLEGTFEHQGSISLQSGMVNPNLQQMVLESLFSNPEGPFVGNNMMWKKVVNQLESFGQGLSFSFEGSAEPLPESRSVGIEDGYHVFRSVAQKNWNTMRSYYHKATLAYSNGELAHASYLAEKGKCYKKLAHEADEKASQQIFESRNLGIRNTVTIDLHGQHVKQAIRLVKLHLLLFAYIPSVQFLRVITGCGGDGLGLGKVKRAVLDLVQKECIKCSEENSGTLLLSMGTQRSFSFMDSEFDSDET